MSGGIRWDGETRQYAGTRIGYWANEIIERLRMPQDERQNIKDEIWADVIKRGRRYNPALSSPHTFIARLVYNRAQELLALYGDGKCRIWREYRSLTTAVAKKDGDAVGERIGVVREDRILDRDDDATDFRARERRLHLRIVIEVRISKLPADLAWLAKRLKVETLTEIARDTGIPRTTLHGRMKKLRPHFDDLR